MSRIEKTESTSVPALPVKDEVVEVYSDKTTKRHWKSSCFMILLTFLFLLVGISAWMMAATGLISVPLFSQFAFSVPQPVHVVSPGISADQVAQTYFQTTVIKRLQAGGGELKDKSISLSLSENSLTSMLQNQLKLAGVDFIDSAKAQIAVLPNNELEVFLPVRWNQQSSAFIIKMKIIAEQGSFNLHVEQMMLGKMYVPSSLIAVFMESFVNRELATLNQALSSYIKVDSFKTDQGQLMISGIFTVEIKK